MARNQSEKKPELPPGWDWSKPKQPMFFRVTHKLRGDLCETRLRRNAIYGAWYCHKNGEFPWVFPHN